MEKIYLPVDVTGKCVVIENEDVIRVYDDEVPGLETTVSFTDYYYKSNYVSVKGTNVLEIQPQCEDISRFTTSYQYRTDFSDILFITMCIVTVVFFIIKTIVTAFFRRVK